MINPCCGRDLQQAAKAVAVFDTVLSIFELITAIILETGPVEILTTETDNPDQRDVNYIVSITLLFTICLVIVKIAQLSVSLLLLYGVIQRDYKKCAIWFYFGCFLVSLSVLHIVFETVIRDQLVVDDGPVFLRILIPTFEILLNWYLMWVVYAFMRELKRTEAVNSASGEEMMPIPTKF